MLFRIPITLAFFVLFTSMCSGQEDRLDTHRPNVLIIVADDLGYSDLGSFGGEIKTENMDILAHRGIQLTNFYAAPTCSPSRAMLLSGTDNHLVGLGTQKYYWSEEQKGRPGYEGQLNNRFVTIATRFKDAGYHTYMAGKWHLGYDRESYPSARGFEESFALLEGGASHFDQRGVISKAPKANYRKNGQAVDLPKNFFSSEFYTDTLINNIERNRQDGKPFFAYAAYTAPHWPLQAPAEFSDKYKHIYDVGYEAIAEARLKRMKEKGILSEYTLANPGTAYYPQWKQLTTAQKVREARLMEIYAGMVESLDFHIGRLITYLEDTGELDNTVIFFMSDNGAEGSNPLDIRAGKTPNSSWIPENFDNSLENLGKAGSYVSVGPGWARVSSTPYRLHKGFTTEGGIKVPAFIYYPKMARSTAISSEFITVRDIAPTLMELAGLEPSLNSYQGRKVLPVTGKSLIKHLWGKERSVHGEQFTAGWELFGRRAIRYGTWKMIWLNEPWGKEVWELYDLANDPGEMNDLAAARPDIVKKLNSHWESYVRQNEMVVVDKVDILYTNGRSHYQENPNKPLENTSINY
ncbi:arylsulfatase [Pseudomaricurvus alkylphenolicus]|uniref:arylsulfatase n=1 Tax=Pseudomaricurvus alkylphenolicus TaxID=1306991 RepID=UPI00141E2235|nr:arylsulfatase [Pseudomaricurvus alkylphenolicus]NIB40672.1 arylsulfatase [Pseudomaricurvus alkylphenolicus]